MKRLFRIIAAVIAALALVSSLACSGGKKPQTVDATAEPGGFGFSTTDVNGDPIAFTDFSDKKVIMINFWETWCGPCVNELPDLQKIYEKYEGEGLVIIGVYSSSNKADVTSLVNKVGITYPIMECVSSLEGFRTEYVPTTVFFDGAGNFIGSTLVGSRSFEAWDGVVSSLLEKQ
ncbi:MAG: TlpA family protein disulfide reductase [Clostridia bacterium]|nr:TlpA family protein disulfide reductase [Clostridia bacterium]